MTTRDGEHGDDGGWKDRHGEPAGVLVRQPTGPGTHARVARLVARTDCNRTAGNSSPLGIYNFTLNLAAVSRKRQQEKQKCSRFH